ncbi:pseudouridine synthase [Neisseria gonorrhoeae]|uniref:Pseudouridine synthase n=1 Tax=Neisseria gonorrhoeae TaxID=485 RepID=A0A378VZL2_NEIGO|nr:pseudouridine synthase [Neisseria gonorrhoeae]
MARRCSPVCQETAKPFKSKARPKDETRKTAAQAYGQKASDGIKLQNAPNSAPPKPKTRRPQSQPKIMEHARDLKERRSDLSRMEPERLQKCLQPPASARAAKWKNGSTTAG